MWIVNGTVLDVRTGKLARRHLEVRDGRIASIVVERPTGAEGEIFDLDGQFLLPGFCDCHVHICANSHKPEVINSWYGALPGTIALYAAQGARRLLLAGITTARDVGGWDYHEIAVREAIRAGWMPGARLLCAGRILTITTGTTTYWPGMYEEADGSDAVRKAARKQLSMGADLIKILATGAVTSTTYESPAVIQYRPEEIRAAVEIAADNNTYVAAHAHAAAGIQNAVECGCRSIEHTVYGTESVYRLMVERGTFLVPTTCVTQAMLHDPAFCAQVPEHLRKRYVEIHETHVANIRLAHKLGVRIAMGSDAGSPGNHCGDNMQELEVMVRECGMSELAAIQSATLTATELLRLDSDLGALEVGKIADIIATPANPLEDISTLRKVSFVMKDGIVARNDRGNTGLPG